VDALLLRNLWTARRPDPERQPADVIWTIDQTGFRSLLTEEELRDLAVICPPRPLRKGEAVYRVGDPADHFFLLLGGQVKLSLPLPKGQRILRVAVPDDIFGESFLTDARQRHTEATCLSEPAMVCPVSREQWLEVARRRPRILTVFSSLLASRLADLERRLAEDHRPLEQRLARSLLGLTYRLGRDLGDGSSALELDLTQEELGALIGAARVSTTELLSRWRQRGILSGTRGRYRVDVSALRQVARSDSD
jgi:CRP-like cAMP-binding protein